MRPFFAKLLTRLVGWLQPKAMPTALAAAPPGQGFLDAFRRQRPPTANELLNELKNTAWTCASINAAVCASFPPKLYIGTSGNQPVARCLTRPLSALQVKRLRATPHLEHWTRGLDRIEEVTQHPLLDLLAQVNPIHNGFDLFENTTLSQEIHGVAYWYIEQGPLGIPATSGRCRRKICRRFVSRIARTWSISIFIAAAVRSSAFGLTR